MYSAEDMNELTKRAKQQLEDQVKEPNRDIYSDFREERWAEGEEEDVPTSLNPYPNQDELQANPSLWGEEEEEELDPLAAYDIEIFENGPMVSQVELWKKEWPNHDVFAVEILGERFVARSLNRFEYKQLVALANVNALQREEIICETCVFFPMNYDFRVMASAKAGTISTLAQVIMEHSGFTKEYVIRML